MRRKFFKKNSQNREYVKTFCTDLINPFNFGIRKWMINQWFQSPFSKTSSRNSNFQDFFNNIQYVSIFKNFFNDIYHVSCFTW